MWWEKKPTALMRNLSFCSTRALKCWWGEGIQPWSVLYPGHVQNLTLLSLRDARLQRQNQTSLVTTKSNTSGFRVWPCNMQQVYYTVSACALLRGFHHAHFPHLQLSAAGCSHPLLCLGYNKQFAGFSFSSTLSIILTSSYIQLSVWLHKHLS